MLDVLRSIIQEVSRASNLEAVLDIIVEKAIENKLGARGLRGICEAIMTDAMYELPSSEESGPQELRITLSYAAEKLAGSRLSKLKVAS